MTKIIFLDMDGVCCTERAHVAQRSTACPMEVLDREAVGLLNALVDTVPDLKFVLSSTWRYHFDQPWMERHLRKFGWAGAFHEDWKTDRLINAQFSRSIQRGDEVNEWLSRHPDIESHVILDDNLDFHDDQPLVLTDIYNGMLYEHYLKAKRILMGEPEPRKSDWVILP